MALDKPKINLIWPELKYIFFKKKYMASIDVTDGCNLNCKYCYHRDSALPEREAAINQWEERFRDFYKRGIRYLHLIGGEPSLRYDVLKLAESYFPFVDVFTNGQIKIPEEFNHRILLSLDGLEEEHDDLHGKGTFKKAVDNYSGDKRVVIHSTFSKMNYLGPKRLKEFIDFVRSMKIRGLRPNLYIPKTGEDDSLMLGDGQRQEIGETLLKELNRKESILLMTKGSVKYIADENLPTSGSCFNTRIYFFDSQGKNKKCVGPELDCSRCLLATFRYNPSFFEFKEWLSHKRLFYKSLP